MAGLGAPAVSALAASWERLDATGRRRAVRVFAEGARQSAEEGVAALAVAARDANEEVREPALSALGTLGPSAADALSVLVREPAPIGDGAVRPLLRHEPGQVIPALLGALAAERASERPLLREGLAQALGRAAEAERRPFEA